MSDDLKHLRVLYVEDDEATMGAFSKFLKLRVGKLFTACSGEEALQKFYEYKPNLLIVDLIMSGMSGLEMIREIRKNDRSCRILITSSINEINTVLEAVDLGIDHYIVKPIDTDALERKMEGVARDIISREAKLQAAAFTNLENTGLMEDAIRREFLKIMKAYSGKGPQDVKILLLEKQVEIIVIDAFTVLEKTVTSNRKNLSMAEQFRKLYYEEISQKLEECVEQITGCKAKVTSLHSDGAKKVDKITLTAI